MKEPNDTESTKKRIIEEIAALSRLLGMIPSDDTIELNEPLTRDSMMLREWMDEARSALLSLSVLVGKELDIQLQ